MKAVRVDAEWAPREGYRLSKFEEEGRRAVNGNQVWRAPEWQLVTDHPMPEIRQPDELLLKVKACGMCGSDVHMYETDDEGYMLLAYHTKFSCVLGHEFSGEVVEVGAGVTRFRQGDAVAVEEINYCGTCRACIMGYFNQCPNAEDIGFTIDGAFAEYVVVRERYCWSLNALRDIYDDEKVYEIGALTEPTSVAYQGMFTRSGGFRPGANVAIFGCGPIGLAGVQLARASGAATIVAFDTGKERREIAKACGADLVLDPVAVTNGGSRPAEEIMVATRGEGVGLALEASGAGRFVFPEIEDSLDYGGKVVVIGIDAQPAPILFAKYLNNAGRIYGSLGHCGGDFGNTINLHLAKAIDMSKVVTARYKLDDGVAAVVKTAERVDAKVLVKPEAV
jgi:threonine dehydrogenase-like Zn-dependent dehydrogenase